MQNKGFISTIAILLIIICGFYISFSLVTSHYEKKAEEYATAMAGTNDVTNDAYKQALKSYNDSLDKEKVYLTYTYNDVRKMEIGMGLDLKGGMNVVLEISVPDILVQYASGSAQEAKIKDAIAKTKANGSKSSDANFISELAKNFQEGTMSGLFKHEGKLANLKSNASNSEVVAALEEEVESQVDAAFNIFRTRIDQFGVVAPNIQKLQDKRGQILLELPGVKEPERVTDLLKSSANLEFYKTYVLSEIQAPLMQLSQTLKANDSTQTATLVELLRLREQGNTPQMGLVAERDTAVVNAMLRDPVAANILPSDLNPTWSVKPVGFPVYNENGDIVLKNGKTIKPQEADQYEGQIKQNEYFQLIALRGEPVLNGDVVTGATYETEQMKGNVVNMTMNDAGAREWANITRDNIDKAIAIVLDNKVYSYPSIRSEITGGRSEITGNFTLEEANDLANVLKSGKMNAKIDVISNNVIGPSLGAEAVQQGFLSFIVAIALLMVFMICVYGLIPGLVANVGLILNLYFTLGILASLQAVLTLSGIAGIVLSLGMAVDANVLIFERTKEELHSGKKLRQAISDGYSNAFSAIFDSNLTSVITGVILLLFGSGPIKGFATTLIIGLVCSFFTSIFLTRIAFDWITKNGRNAGMTFDTKISRNLFSNTKINFLGKGKAAAAVWLILIVISIASLAIRGMNQGIDFSGGRNYVVQLAKDVDAKDLEKRLGDQFRAEANDETVSVGVITIDNPSKVRISTNYKIDSDDQNVEKEISNMLYQGLQEELRGANGQVMSQDNFAIADESQGIVSIQKVGPSVADDMRRDAFWAVGIAVVCMFLYILLRFRNVAFSVGAVCAVALTAFLIIGFYSICWGFLPFSMEIDQSFIAAVLTIIGYQINDTVVVFDRVREMMKLYPKEDRFETINRSLNTTLARTIMTSLSTLLVLLCIFFLGGDTIRSFTFAMIFGVVVGTFCSLFCAAPIAYQIMKTQHKKVAEASETTKLEGNRRFK